MVKEVDNGVVQVMPEKETKPCEEFVENEPGDGCIYAEYLVHESEIRERDIYVCRCAMSLRNSMECINSIELDSSDVPAAAEKDKPGEPRTIRLSEMTYDRGCKPSRIVLRQIGVRLVTHMKVYPPTTDNKDPHYVWGHYFTSLDEANKDFEKRCRRYNVEEVDNEQ